jgi:hypothetical protein
MKAKYDRQITVDKDLVAAPWDAEKQTLYQSTYGLLYAAGACQARRAALAALRRASRQRLPTAAE